MRPARFRRLRGTGLAVRALCIAGSLVVFVTSMRAEAGMVEAGAAASDPALLVEECSFEHARYAPIEPQAGRHPASLDFRAGDTILGLAATLTTPQGVAVEMYFGFSNGYVRYHMSAAADDVSLDSVIQGFKSDMTWTRISSDDPAAAYLIMPDAAFHAKQTLPIGKDGSKAVFTIPDGLWHLVGCAR